MNLKSTTSGQSRRFNSSAKIYLFDASLPVGRLTSGVFKSHLVGKKMIFILFLIALLGFSSEISAQLYKIDKKESFQLSTYLVKEGYVRLKMKKLASGHLHLQGKLNGVDGNFILDTGATGTVIEIKNKKQFKMQTTDSDRQATGAGGSRIQMQASAKNDLKIGKLDLRNINLMLMSLDHVNNAFERLGLSKVNGVIGADILTNQKAIIDYTDLSLYLKKQG